MHHHKIGHIYNHVIDRKTYSIDMVKGEIKDGTKVIVPLSECTEYVEEPRNCNCFAHTELDCCCGADWTHPDVSFLEEKLKRCELGFKLISQNLENHSDIEGIQLIKAQSDLYIKELESFKNRI